MRTMERPFCCSIDYIRPIIQTSQLSRIGREAHDFKVNLTIETNTHDLSRRAQIIYIIGA